MSSVFYNPITGDFYGRVGGVETVFPIGGSFGAGSVIFSDGSGFAESPDIFWDDPNSRLGLGTPTPAQTLDVVGNVSISSQLFIGGLTILDTNQLTFVFDGPVRIENNSTNGSAGILFNGGAGSSNFVTFLSTIGVGTTDFISFRTGNNGAVLAMEINTVGLIGIGNNAFPTSGNKGLVFSDATPFSGMPANTSGLFSDSGDMFCIDDADSVTRLNHINRALGGGSGATLGTIGGSGPATAAQNSWMEYVVNGVTYWIPVWR